MNEDDFIRTAEGALVLYLTRPDLEDLKRASEFPYGLRYKFSELEPYTLPNWNHRTNTLGSRFSTKEAQHEYLIDMRLRGRIPMTPMEHRIHLHILPDQANDVGAQYDPFAEMYYVPDDRPDVNELKASYVGGAHKARWEAWRTSIRTRKEMQRRAIRESHAYLFAREIAPRRGPKPGCDRWWRNMAWSYFQDLAAIGTIHSNSSQTELFDLIVNELFFWSIHITPGALRRIGTDWKAELRKLPPTPNPIAGCQ